MNRDFVGKYGPWALITGASDGIGCAIARELAERGMNLVLCARSTEKLNSLSAELRRAHGIQAEPVRLDLSDSGSVDSFLDQYDSYDIGLVVLAAGFGSAGGFDGLDIRSELQMIDVNCKVPVRLCHHFAHRFRQKGRGGLILFSSLLAFQGVPFAATYAATKAFIQNFGEALKFELSGYGIDVLVAAPGPVLSGFGSRAKMRMTMGLKPGQISKSIVQALGRKTTVRPGWLSIFLEWSLKPLPRLGRVLAMKRIMRNML